MNTTSGVNFLTCEARGRLLALKHDGKDVLGNWVSVGDQGFLGHLDAPIPDSTVVATVLGKMLELGGGAEDQVLGALCRMFGEGPEVELVPATTPPVTAETGNGWPTQDPADGSGGWPQLTAETPPACPDTMAGLLQKMEPRMRDRVQELLDRSPDGPSPYRMRKD
jgi:hypothetical protein